MTAERTVLAKHLLKGRKETRKQWQWISDNGIPEGSGMYAVYDGMEIIGAGFTKGRIPDLVSRADLPIVLWLPDSANAEKPRAAQTAEKSANAKGAC